MLSVASSYLRPCALSVCIVSITRLMPGVHQPDPPGLIHDDLRLLPPWRGSSLFRTLFVGRIVGEVRGSCGISFSLPSSAQPVHSSRLIHRCRNGTGVASRPRRQCGLMSAGNGVLAMLADADVRDDVDRVAAAAGVARRPCCASRRVGKAWTGGHGGRSRRGRSRQLLGAVAAAARPRHHGQPR